MDNTETQPPPTPKVNKPPPKPPVIYPPIVPKLPVHPPIVYPPTVTKTPVHPPPVPTPSPPIVYLPVIPKPPVHPPIVYPPVVPKPPVHPLPVPTPSPPIVYPPVVPTRCPLLPPPPYGEAVSSSSGTADVPHRHAKAGGAGCVDVLEGLVHVGIGSSTKDTCCPVLEGLLDLDAAVCLCTTIRAKLLNISIVIPIALKVMIECGKFPSPGFQCPAA